MSETDFVEIQILLRQNGFTVTQARCQSESFGSWYVTIAAKPSVRIVWDGRDGRLSIEQETSRLFNGSHVWQDIWAGEVRPQQTPECVLDVLLARFGPGA